MNKILETTSLGFSKFKNLQFIIERMEIFFLHCLKYGNFFVIII